MDAILSLDLCWPMETRPDYSLASLGSAIAGFGTVAACRRYRILKSSKASAIDRMFRLLISNG